MVSESECVAWWFKVMFTFPTWIICDRTGTLLSMQHKWHGRVFVPPAVMSFLARNLKKDVQFLQRIEFWSSIEKLVMPLINENIDDEVEVIPDYPPELHSAEPKRGYATSPSVSDEVQERPVDIHLLEYIECKTNKNTKGPIDQCAHRFREFLVLSPRCRACDIGEISAKNWMFWLANSWETIKN